MGDEKEVSFSRGDVIAQKFEIEKELGSGMLGTTYLVRHISSEKYLALKVLRPKLVANPLDRKRFDACFEKACKVESDGVVRLGEVGEFNGNVYFTSEYFESQNLRVLMDEYLEQQKTFSLEESCQIIVQTLEALVDLHAAGITHRNLKPENILVATRGAGPGGKNVVRTVKVSDAGLADIINPTILAESYISRQEARYLAPEVSSFEHAGLPQSDVYSAGVMLYELVVGQTPRGTYLAPTQLRGDLPEHIDDIVEIALASWPEDRYPTAKDMLVDLQRFFSGELIVDKTPVSFRNVLIGLGLIGVVFATMGVYLNVRETPDPLAAAKIQDEEIRRDVLEVVKIPSEAQMEAMVAKHPEMLYIPPGPFVMGRLNQEPLKEQDLVTETLVQVASQSEPLAETTEVSGFYIDRYEFPNRKNNVDGTPVKPVAKATWSDAQKTCESINKRLCTEEEWEKSCKGPANYIFTYGDTYDDEECAVGVNDPYNLGDNPECMSDYGVQGLSGGKREWTSTQAGSKENRRVVKGGLSSNSSMSGENTKEPTLDPIKRRGSRCAFAVDESIGYADNTLSFRCCLDVGAKTADADAEPAKP